jgi:hypothetical protein
MKELCVPGMHLSDSFEPDLSHTSILYYYDTTRNKKYLISAIKKERNYLQFSAIVFYY